MTAWSDAAGCSEEPVDLFYKARHKAAALAICAGCPMADLCLEDALATPHHDDWGIRGGTTRGARRQMRVERRRHAARLRELVAEMRQARADRLEVWAARQESRRRRRPSVRRARSRTVTPVHMEAAA